MSGAKQSYLATVAMRGQSSSGWGLNPRCAAVLRSCNAPVKSLALIGGASAESAEQHIEVLAEALSIRKT
jgi:hypothetical protein